MWAFARYELHLSAKEFYSLTPRQYDALLRRHRQRMESNEFLFAQLTSWVANTGFRSTENPTQARDFMPSQWAKVAAVSTPRKTIRMTTRRRVAVAQTLRALFPPR